MQLYVQQDEFTTSLNVKPYFATLVEESDDKVTFEVRFSILQSEIFYKSLSSIRLSVINKDVIKNKNGLQSISYNLSRPTKVDEDIGAYEIQEILLKNAVQISNAKFKQDSIIFSKKINLQSYINPESLKDFQAKKNIENIPSLYKSVFTLENSQDFTSYDEVNFSSEDIKRLNHQLIGQFLIDPSEVVSNNPPAQNNSVGIVNSIRQFYLSNALTALDTTTQLSVVKKSKLVDRVYISELVEIPKNLITDELIFEFQVFVEKKLVPVQRIEKRISYLKHLKLSKIINSVPSFFFLNRTLKINQNSDLESYSIKVKEINANGDFSFYSKIEQEQPITSYNESLDLRKNIFFKSSPRSSKLLKVNEAPRNSIKVYRCKFENPNTTYSSPFFKNVVNGSPIKINSTTLVIESEPSSGNPQLKISNYPYNARQFQIFRRILFKGLGSSEFIPITNFENLSNLVSAFVDTKANVGTTYEYMIKYKNVDGTVSYGTSQTYNFGNKNLVTSVSTEILNESVGVESNNDIKVNFNIQTDVPPDDASKVREMLSNQNNLAYFANELQSMKNDFTNLFFYKVSRVNLKTGERETFENVQMRAFGTGEISFEDSNMTRRNFGISKIDGNVNYKYEVRLFLRSPEVALRHRVNVMSNSVIGKSGKIKSYFFSPYKWRQDLTARTGMIPAQNDEGKIITQSFLEEGELGVVATYILNNTKKDLGVYYVSAERLDLKKVKVLWSIKQQISEYDHFILIKEVNRKREFIGAVDSLEYIDVLKDTDLGAIRYYVIPILNDYSIVSAYASNFVLVDPEEFF